MGRRGPKKKVNMIRKWWQFHKITLDDISSIVKECKDQLPLMARTIDDSLVISALAAREARKVDDGLFDAEEFLLSFRPGEDEEEEEVAETQTAG